MAEQYVPNLGQLADDAARRDAVHVAVAPVVAQHNLEPGEVVVVRDGLARSRIKEDRGVGVVDPFLRETVRPGERFWLFLYPNTVTSIRHVWLHPAFTPKVPTKEESNP